MLLVHGVAGKLDTEEQHEQLVTVGTVVAVAEKLRRQGVIWMTEFITTAVQTRRVETSTPNIAQSIGYNLTLPK